MELTTRPPGSSAGAGGVSAEESAGVKFDMDDVNWLNFYVYVIQMRRELESFAARAEPQGSVARAYRGV